MNIETTSRFSKVFVKEKFTTKFLAIHSPSSLRAYELHCSHELFNLLERNHSSDLIFYFFVFIFQGGHGHGGYGGGHGGGYSAPAPAVKILKVSIFSYTI